ncbi:MAG: DNA translocase FtsK [Planctomycetes bacterium]|nr:DNA translocase FtsK [Planctomycetota bacterium]
MPPLNKPSTRRRDGVSESFLVAALAAQLLLLVALVMHGPDDGASPSLVGSIGRFAATMVYGAFGVLSYLLVALGLWTTALRLARKEISSPRWRAAGFVLFLLGGCTLIHQFFPASALGGPRASPFGFEPGGALGSLTFSVTHPALGSVGTFLFSVVMLCTGLAFATDWLLYEMAYEIVRRAGSLFGALKRFWPEPAIAGVPREDGADTSSARPRAQLAAPSREAIDVTAMRSSTAVAPTTTMPDFSFPAAPAVGPASAAAAVSPPSPTASSEVEFLPPEAQPNAARFDDTHTNDDASAVALDDPVIDVPAELVPPKLPKMLPPAPSAAAPAVAAAVTAPVSLPELDDVEDFDDSAEFEESVSGDAADDDVGEIDEDAVPVPEPPKPVMQVKIDAPVRPKLPTFRVERPRIDGEYEYPSHQLLERPKPRNLKQLEAAIQSNAEILQRTLAEFKIEGQVVAFQQGPVVTMLEVALAPGTKVTRIHSLADDLAMALKAEAVRIVAPIPGKSTVGVEIPNPVRDDVRMLTILESPEFRDSKCAVPMLLGCAADGRPLVEDLASMPHLLIAGSTGSGKSVCINTILLSVLLTRTPDEVRLILIDPKQVELAFFANVPHLLSPVVTDMKRASGVLEWALDKMEERYDLLRRFEVRNIASYNEIGEKAILARAKELEMDDEVVVIKLPYIVIVVDELADLMLAVGKDVETAITRLAQKSRAVGIHVILATQRPSTDVITGLIKANMPTRIAFKVASKIDSRVILDQNGAEKLLGMGDMLYMPPRASTIARAQGTYAADREVKRVVGFLRERYPQEFSEELVNLNSAPLLSDAEKDELYDEAVRIVLGEQRGSASLLQRALSIGYTRASRLLDLMRAEGVVGAYKGSKASEVTMTLEEYEARVASQGGRTASRSDEDDLDFE